MVDRADRAALGLPANDNPRWHWRGVCDAWGINMGPVRDAPLCRDCTTAWLAALKGPNGEAVNTADVPDHLRRIGIVGLYKHAPCRLVTTNSENGDVA